ncbi:MAG TPA: PH domain-containing protein, partial [Actinomycetales bacterium]|nr:PH domain-containing protein [Actinomycetales bacterium]
MPSSPGEAREPVPQPPGTSTSGPGVAPVTDWTTLAKAVAHEGDWQRLHPLTPLVRGWKVLAAVLVILGQQQGPELVQRGMPNRTEALIALAVIGAVVAVGGVYVWLAWQRAEYRVDGEALQMRTGVLFRSERQARLDRLQAVDVVRPILARIFGLAELKLEVAGGGDSAVRLSLLPEDEAQRLRNTLLARAAGVRYEGETAPEAPEREVLTVPVGRTIESTVRSASTIVLLMLVVALVVASLVVRNVAPLLGLGPAALGLGATMWQKFSAAFGFRVALSPDGIRLHHGLLTTRAQTVPPGRVQAVRVAQPLLWRSKDWWRVEVNVAGYGGGGKQDSHAQENLLLAVGTRAEALEVLALAMPLLGDEPADADERVDWLAAVQAGLTGTGTDGGFTASPSSSRWLDPVGWRRHGVLVGPRVLLARRGVVVRELDVVPHARTQSL